MVVAGSTDQDRSGEAADEADAVRRVVEAFGASVYCESVDHFRIDVDTAGILGLLASGRSGFAIGAVQPHGVTEVCAATGSRSGFDEARAARLAARIATLPPGRYVLGAGAAQVRRPVPEELLAFASSVAALHRTRRRVVPDDLRMRLVVEATRRRVVVCGRVGPAVKHESWARLSCFVVDGANRDLGKATHIVAPLPRPERDGGWGLSGWTGPEAVDAVVAQACAQAGRLVRAEGTPVGAQRVVFAADPAGTLAHELVGHLLESDNVHAGGGPIVGERVGPETLGLIHDATPQYPWSGAPVDDAGAPTGRRVLIERGVVVAHLVADDHDDHGDRGVANPRRSAFDVPALPRMSTVVVAAGDNAGDEPHDFPAGLLVRDISGAHMDPRTGRCVLRIREAAVGCPGRPPRATRGGTIRCDIRAALAGIEAVGTTPVFSPALCFKQAQRLPTGAVAPSIRINGLTVGN